MRICFGDRRRRKIRQCHIGHIVFMVIVFVCIRPFVMFWIDTKLDPSRSDISCLVCKTYSVNRTNYIPKIIHQIFFYISDDTIPKHLKNAQRSWHLFNPDFQYILWNSSMVDHLIQQHYPSQWTLYNSYSRWVQRADFARYVILHHYGGIYVDIDIECISSMRQVNKTFPSNAEFVMYETRPYGVSNDFLMSKPKHPFIASVINGLSSANRWYIIPYLTVFCSTGPLYLYGRYMSYQKKSDILILDISRTVSFLYHKDGAAWHQLDGKVVWWIYEHRDLSFRYALSAFAVCAVAVSVLALLKSRMWIRQQIRRCRHSVHV